MLRSALVDTRRLCGLRPYVVILVSLHLFTVLADLSTVPADLTYLLTSTFPIALPSVCLLSARYLQFAYPKLLSGVIQVSLGLLLTCSSFIVAKGSSEQLTTVS